MRLSDTILAPLDKLVVQCARDIAHEMALSTAGKPADLKQIEELCFLRFGTFS